MRHLYRSAGLLAAAVVACSGSVASSPDGGGAGSSSGGSSGSASSSGGLSTQCPASPPSDGASCSDVGLECEYGSDVNIDCDTIAACQTTGWKVTPPATSRCPTPGPGPSCPASYAAVPQQSTCSSAATCAYPEGTCSCEVYCGPQYPVGHACEAGTPMTWQCTGAAQGCPATRPLVGSACTSDGESCNYGDCNTIGVVCRSGTWHTQMNGCPVSTARDKQQVRYLGEGELRSLAAQTLETRLATYAYTFGEPGRRLGFVIEDQPDSPAVARGKDRVDLYAYTSMTVATLQVQQREIEELRREIAALRARADACGPSR